MEGWQGLLGRSGGPGWTVSPCQRRRRQALLGVGIVPVTAGTKGRLPLRSFCRVLPFLSPGTEGVQGLGEAHP